MKDNFDSAVRFALDAHQGQLDKGWTPYIMHLMGVWSRVRETSHRIMNEKYLDHRDAIVNIIVDETTHRFERMHMKSMEWLVRSFQPSGTAMFWILIFGIIASGAACFASHQFRKDGGY